MVALLVVRARARISTALSTGVERARSIPRSGVFLDGSSARAVYSMTAAASCRPTRRKASIPLDEGTYPAPHPRAQGGHRFLGRMRTKNGRRVLAARRKKGRKRLTV